ncbi:MAG TPA: redoxin domain-containing protein [Kofleriaceae bacterium]|nr:redoxin domain-containing protein [Kofleriaceae bacterium]
MAAHLRELVAAGWLGWSNGLAVGVGAFVSAISRAIATDVLVLFGAALVLTVAAGRKRSLGRDMDLACVAFVPYMVVKAAAALILLAANRVPASWVELAVWAAGLAWCGVLLALAWRQASARPDRGGETAVTRPAVRWAGRAVLLILAGLVATNLVWMGRNWAAMRPIAAGDVAPLFVLPEIDRAGEPTGRRISLEAARGQVVLIDFWADWCAPCRQSMPMIERLYRRYRDRGFTVLSVKIDGAEMNLAATVIRATSFPLAVDTGGVADHYNVSTIPHLVLVDHLGVVRRVHHGGRGAGDLPGEIEALLTRRP